LGTGLEAAARSFRGLTSGSSPLRQIDADLKAGKHDALIREARRAHRACQPSAAADERRSQEWPVEAAIPRGSRLIAPALGRMGSEMVKVKYDDPDSIQDSFVGRSRTQ
jgi:hypothetical protein